jgi:glycosyltransferase involved in cell wall biosynthesis
MKIAIDASRAFLHERTGIEEYSYQLIKHLREPLEDKKVILFLRRGTRDNIDFPLPDTWRVKELWAPRLWTYVRLSLSLLWHRPTHLLVPGHIVPPIHPKNTTVVIHGLEYEMHPASYSAYERWTMRRGIKNSCKWARNIVCVSNNTKKDLMDLYKIDSQKIRVVYEGVNIAPVEDLVTTTAALQKFGLQKMGYIIFIGRIEERKNIVEILNAYEIVRRHFYLQQRLVLVGKGGYGYDRIKKVIDAHPFSADIVCTGFVTTEEKWALLRNASVFVFPTLYEGFGLPVLEAQQVGVPVVTSSNSSLQEIARDSALLADPSSATDIAHHIHTLISDPAVREDMIHRGQDNITRFTWERCARLVTKMLLHKK